MGVASGRQAMRRRSFLQNLVHEVVDWRFP